MNRIHYRINSDPQKKQRINFGLIILLLLGSIFPLDANLLNTDYTFNIRFSELSHSIYVHQQVDIFNHSQLTLDTIYFHLSPNAFSSTKSVFYQQSENLLNEPLKFKIQSVSIGNTACHILNEKTLSMAVILATPVSPGDSVKIQMDYILTLPRGSYAQCSSYNGSNVRLFRFYPMVERLTENGWTPREYNSISPTCTSPARYTMSIQLPAKSNVVCSLPPSTTTEIDSTEQIQNFNTRMLKELAIVFSGSSQLTSDDIQGLSIQYLLPKSATPAYQLLSKSEMIRTITCQIIEEYSKFLPDYPHSHFAVAITSIDKGISTPNMVILNSHEFINLTKLDYGSLYHYAQSISEQYFYFYVFEDPGNPDWLNDGLAAFAANKFMQNNFDRLQKLYQKKPILESSYAKTALHLAALAIDQEKVSRPLYTSSRKSDAPVLLDQINHFKSQKILEIFNYYVGDSIFQATVHDFILENQYKPIHSDQFIDLLERKSNKNLSAIRKIWIDSDELPDIKIQKVKTKHLKEKEIYSTSVITRGAALAAMPVEVLAIDLAADTLTALTRIKSDGIDTVHFDSKYPLRKISLDPERHVWEFNRLNNHYPYQVFFNFLIGIPRIDAYQVFYYPTFDFNKRDLSRIGIMLRGRYWINMRPLFPAQSLDEWTLGINYGLRSKTVGYNVSYSTSLLQFFFQPRIHFRSRDYFGLNETAVSTDIYFGEITYPLLHKIQGYKKISIGTRYQNVRTLEFLNHNNWERGKLLEPYIEFINFHNWGRYRHVLNINLNNGVDFFDTDYTFTKLAVDAQIKFRPSEKLWLYDRVFFGASKGNIPLQHYFYFFGKNTLENMSFESFRLVKGAGDMRGYGAASPKGRNILTNNAEFRWTFAGIEPAIFDLIVFFDSGLTSDSFPKMNGHQLKYDAGIGTEFNTLETITVGLHIPFWVSHPVDSKSQFALRWVVSVDLSL